MHEIITITEVKLKRVIKYYFKNATVEAEADFHSAERVSEWTCLLA